MNIPQLFTDGESDRAVSPVIGVILMVAITVILAAVIGTFVLQLGQNTGTQAPTPSLSVSDASDNYDPVVVSSGPGDYANQSLIQLESSGGDRLPASDVRIIIRNDDNQIVGAWEQGTWETDLQNDQSGSGYVSEWVLLLNNDDSAFGSAAYQDTEIAPGDLLELRASAENTTASGPAGPATLQNVPDESDYTLQIVHTPSDKVILESEVRVR